MNISKQSKTALFASTGLWSLITLVICVLIFYQVQVSEHFSYYILLEFSKAIDLWYILCVFCAFAIDIANKKKK